MGTTYYYVEVKNTDSGLTPVTMTCGPTAVAVSADGTTPAITAEPTSETIDSGEKATLSVTAVGAHGTLTYQWYSNTTHSNTGGTPISGATSHSYTTPTLTGGNHYYYCVVTNTYSGGTATATSSVATITLNAAPPTIGTQPAATNSVTVGGTVTLSVNASVTGGGTLTYQWYSHTTASHSSGTSTLISGATLASYSPSTSTAGTYHYYCVVKHTDTAVGGAHDATVTSNVATVTVTSIPDLSGNVTISPSSPTVNTLLTASYSGSETITTWQWKKDGTNIGTNSSTYTPTATGSYTVTANAAGFNPKTSAVVTVTASIISSGNALWARTVSAGSNNSSFNAVACDQSGNVYAVGVQEGNGSYEYGTGVTSSGPYVVDNVVLVKYDASGTAQWARTVSPGAAASWFNAVACDQSGNVYAAGYQEGTWSYEYGTGVTATGASSDKNIVLVKYDASGTAQWARTVSAGLYASYFNAVACDQSGNVYAAGVQERTGSYEYGPGVTATGTGGAYGSASNVVLVKYDASGTAQWARTVSAGLYASYFNAVACDQSGNVYAAGVQEGKSCEYGTGVTATAATGEYVLSNVVLVKYDSSGTAQWARTVSAGSGSSIFNAVACDQSGNVYAAGCQYKTGSCEYGPGVSATGVYGDENVVLVKYDSSGTAQWARTVSAGSGSSIFNAVACDQSGNVYAAGEQWGNGSYEYGTGVSATGPGGGAYGVKDVVLVKYDASGTAQWERTVSAGASNSSFNAIACDQSGNVYAAGEQGRDGSYEYGTGVSAKGAYGGYGGSNVVLVKYKQ